MRRTEGDNLQARCDAWLRLGHGDLLELLDARAHHEAFGLMKYYDRTIPVKQVIDRRDMRPPTQDTWRQLIRLLLTYEGRRNDIDAIGDYQCDSWGSTTGETCVVELSALAAQGLSTKREDRKAFRTTRAEHLRQRAVEHAPKFVLMYGGGSELAPYWNLIGCGERETECFKTETIAGREAGLFRGGETVFVRAAHPVNPGGGAPPAAYWDGLAQELRRLSR
jgi:hypothetical protein